MLSYRALGLPIMEPIHSLELLTSGRSYQIFVRQCQYRTNGAPIKGTLDLKFISSMSRTLKHKYRQLERVSLRIRELESERQMLKADIDKILNIVFAKASDHEEPKKPKKWEPACRPVMHIETGKKYDSMSDAARAYNIDKSSLRRSLMNMYKTNKYPFKFI